MHVAKLFAPACPQMKISLLLAGCRCHTVYCRCCWTMGPPAVTRLDIVMLFIPSQPNGRTCKQYEKCVELRQC